MNRIVKKLFTVVLPLTVLAGAETFNIRTADDISEDPLKNWNGKVTTEFDPILKRDVVKINFAVPPNTTKNVSSGIRFPEINKIKWQSIDNIKLHYKGGFGHIVWLIRDRDGEIFGFKKFKRLHGNADAWNEYIGYFNDSDIKNYHNWGGGKKRNKIMDPPLKIAAVNITIYPSYIAAQLRNTGGGNLKPTPEELAHGMNPVDFYISGVTVDGVRYGGKAEIADKFESQSSFNEIGTQVPLKSNSGKKITYQLKNPLNSSAVVKLKAVSELALTDKKEVFEKEIKLEGNAVQNIELPFSFDRNGFYSLSMTETVNGKVSKPVKTFVNVWTPVGNNWKDDPDTFFGTQAALDLWNRQFGKYREQDYKNMRDAGVKLVRFTMRWSAIQPKKDGKEFWGPYDKIVKDICRHGMYPYPMIANAPKWSAADKEVAAKAPKFVYACYPDNNLYAEFVAKVVRRYKNELKYIQIWNEPYANQYYWGGTPDTYADMLKKAYAAAKKENPEIKVNAGACWDEVFKKAQGNFDFWPFHSHGDTETLRTKINKHKKFGVPMRTFWNDETGIATNPFTVDGEFIKARTIIQKGVLSRAAGLSNHVWFVYRSTVKAPTNPRDNFPSIDEKNRCRPVVIAHNNMVHHLKQTKNGKQFHKPGFGEVYQFLRGKEQIIVLWRSDIPRGQIITLKFDKPVKGIKTNLFGTVEPIASVGKNISMTMKQEPFFLTLPDDVKFEDAVFESCFSVPAIHSHPQEAKEQKVTYSFSNPFPHTLKAVLALKPVKGWTPDKNKINIELKSGKTQKIDIIYRRAADAPAISYPGFNFYSANADIQFDGETKFTSNQTIGRKETQLADIRSAVDMVQLRTGDVDADMFWQGEKDLSAKFYGSWDAKALKLKVVVRDNKHFSVQPEGGLFEGDSIQISVNNREYQIGVSLLNDGRKTSFKWRGANRHKPLKNIPFDIVRKGEYTTYTIAIPWSELALSGKAGTEFMLSVLVNDNDGRCRKVLLEWGGGIHGIATFKPQNPMLLK
ncbi:MAG: hypothetical protein J6C40_02290 [Lentisphaeria bacterium]|nr:hypothetical protein [Lentisphaeria bacterium]